MTSPVPDKPRLSVVAEKPPPRRLRILIVTAEDVVIDALRKVFDAFLQHVKDHYRWTATLVATFNQEPQFLRQAIKCRIDGLVFRRPDAAAEFVEQTR